MRPTLYHRASYLAAQKTLDSDPIDARANFLAGLVLIGLATLSVVGLAALVGLVGYGIHLILT